MVIVVFVEVFVVVIEGTLFRLDEGLVRGRILGVVVVVIFSSDSETLVRGEIGEVRDMLGSLVVVAEGASPHFSLSSTLSSCACLDFL